MSPRAAEQAQPEAAGRSLRVGIVGARRVRQGLGPFIARDFERLGHRVCAVLGRSRSTAVEAARAIADLTGKPAPAATSDSTDFYAEKLDCVVVATPAGTHLGPIRTALEHGCHVLAEKPLLWHPEVEWSANAAALESDFHSAELTLDANAQWPYTLPAWGDLFHKLAADSPPRMIAMGLEPSSTGRQMLGDALPHPLSVAQALRPDLERAQQIGFRSEAAGKLHVSATLQGTLGPDLDLRVELTSASAAQPLDAWLEIDGQRAERCIRLRDYAMFFRSGARLVDLPDPLSARIEDFCRSIDQARTQAGDLASTGPSRHLSRRARMLEDFDSAYGAAFGT